MVYCTEKDIVRILENKIRFDIDMAKDTGIYVSAVERLGYPISVMSEFWGSFGGWGKYFLESFSEGEDYIRSGVINEICSD
ncbi:MAG: hypothetical protein V1888_03980 [archaeon]